MGNFQLPSPFSLSSKYKVLPQNLGSTPEPIDYFLNFKHANWNISMIDSLKSSSYFRGK